MINKKHTRPRLRLAAAAAGAAMLLPLLAVSAAAQPADTALLPEQGTCVDKTAILVASDMQAQSDVYAAVALQGVTDGCLIWAGGRDDAEIAGNQVERIVASDGVSHIVGGTAAVAADKAATAAANSPDDTTATRLAGSDRFETARLVGIEAARLAADPMTDDAAEAQAVSVGAVNGSRVFTAKPGTTEIAAVLAAGDWKVTASTAVRGDAQFSPTVEIGDCVEDETQTFDTYKVEFVLAVDDAGECDADDRSVTVALSPYDLADYDEQSDTYDAVPDHKWTVRYELLPPPERVAAVSVSSTARVTETPKVVVPDTDTGSAFQAMRLSGSDRYWLLQVVDAGHGSFDAESAVTLAKAHEVKYGWINEFDGDDRVHYAHERYECVRKVTDEDVLTTLRTLDGDDEDSDPDALPTPTEDVDAVVHVPAGCIGYLAVRVANPVGAGADTADLKAWRVKITPLTVAEAD